MPPAPPRAAKPGATAGASQGGVSATAAPASGHALRPQDAAPASARSFRLLRATPSWLVSSVFHFALLFALALWPLAQAVPHVTEIMLANREAPQEELEIFEPVKIEVQEIETQDVTSTALSSGDIGIASLGEPQAVPTMAAVEMGALAPQMDDIGLLFGKDGKGMADVGAGYGGAQFFGVKAGGRKFVFIVDSSKSMNGGKFEAACYELDQAIRRLSEDQLFYVMFFDWDSNKLRLGKWDRQLNRWVANPEPEERAVFASEENKAHTEQWMKTVELELKTLVLESIETAMEMYPDAIYILTDGRFQDTAKVEKYLAENNYITDEQGNKQPKIVIHTIGFYNRDGEPVLQKIAKEYGGTYRFVPQPAKKRK